MGVRKPRTISADAQENIGDDSMAELLEDDLGRIKPQVEKPDGSGFEAWKGIRGHGNVRSDDGEIATLGSVNNSDTENTVIGRLKKLISLLPAALTAAGNMKVGVAEALPAGTNNIGKVNVANFPEPAVTYQDMTWFPSTTVTASGASEAVTVGGYRRATVFLNVTAVTGSVDVKVETMDPASEEWFEVVAFAQAAGVTKECKAVECIGSSIRINYAVSAGTATFSVGAVVR